MFITLTAIPLVLREFGTDQLGVWLVVMSLIGLIGFAQAGMSGAILTSVSAAASRGGRESVETHIRAGFAVSVRCSVVLASVAGLASLAVDSAAVLNTDTISPNELRRLTSFLIATVATGFVFSFFRAIWLSELRGNRFFLIELILDFFI